MKIRWNGHASFTITSAGNLTIVMDPYEPGAFGGGIGYRLIDAAPDVVTISHDHADHNYVQGFANRPTVLRAAGEAKGLKFRTVDTFHDNAGGAQRGKNKVFVFEVDGVRICHLGDLGHRLSAAQVKEIGPVDVLFAPVGGFYTIDHLEAADAMEKLNPRVVIPMHYKTDKCGFPIAAVGQFLAGKPGVKQLEADEIELSAATLPAAREIIVLRHHY
jgi:L-ascorbate metabolism protein UlaG (beta-lactamase superfamily)